MHREGERKMAKVECSIESDGKDLFVVFNGKRIAKRGRPNSPQARTWVSIEPGFEVHDEEHRICVECAAKLAAH
jgi:hypothetical protein